MKGRFEHPLMNSNLPSPLCKLPLIPVHATIFQVEIKYTNIILIGWYKPFVSFLICSRRNFFTVIWEIHQFIIHYPIP